MKSSNELRTMLRSIDHKSYPAYKSLAGTYQFGTYLLSIDHVQGDPFASPSSLHVEISHKNAGFPAAYYQRDCSRVALQDFLTRRFAPSLRTLTSRQKAPERAACSPSPAAARRGWSEAPARSPQTASPPVST